MKRITSVLAAAVAFTTLVATTPATAQQGGLVNVAIGDISTGDILSENQVSVGVGLNLAANICGTSVGVLASQLGQTGVARCTTATQFVDLTKLGAS